MRRAIAAWLDFQSQFAARCAVAMVSIAAGISAPGAARGDTLFEANYGSGTVGEYTTSGTTVNASLITGLSQPEGIAVSGSDLFVTNNLTGTIGEYTTSGATVNASLITGLSQPARIAVSGSDLFVTNYLTGTIGEYTTSGATVNASLITGLSNAVDITVSGSDLFVTYYTSCVPSKDGGTLCFGNVGEYTTSGATVNASLITGLFFPFSIAVSGSNLFVANETRIGEYTTSGATVNASLITGLQVPVDIALSGANLFVANELNGTIGEYTTSGATVNASLITGLSTPDAIAVAPVPEPSTALLLSVGIVGLAARRRRARGASTR